jgi:hypothetical protein
VSDFEEDGEFQIAEYCARLSCKRLIAQTPGRGRRREYCSDTCRRAADREYKRAKALVEHFERALHKTRHEVAAYGRSSDGALPTPEEEVTRWATAHSALTRARTILEFDAALDGRFREEFAQLVAAVSPLVGDAAPRAVSA